MKKKRQEKEKSLRLAFYFGILIIFIILVSIVFKGIDIFSKSKFDGKNRFTVAVINKNKTTLISVSPQDGSLTGLEIDGVKSLNQLNQLALPHDGYIETPLDEPNPKSYFLKMLFKGRGVQTNLTLIDFLRLGVFSSGVNSDKLVKQKSSIKDVELSNLASKLFVDPMIANQKISLQITNSTDVPGLGNKLARYITNIGGNVVLVNTSSSVVEKSKILYEQDSYTLKKISKMLNIEPQKKESNSISEIIIIIGKDREDLLN